MNILPCIALLLLMVTIAQALIIRHLAIDPGFGIKTRAAGELALRFSFRRRDVIYGDIDHLGKINAALSSPEQLGHDRFNQIMRQTLASIRHADVALVYGGDELRLICASGDGAGLAGRFQQLLAAAPLEVWERQALYAATGLRHVSVTLAVAERSWPAAGLHRAKLAVAAAKPKDAPGQRGLIILL